MESMYKMEMNVRIRVTECCVRGCCMWKNGFVKMLFDMME